MTASQSKIPTKPKGFTAITPTISVADVDAAVAFYADAFGAETVDTLMVPHTETVFHAVIKLAGVSLVLSLDGNAKPYAGPGMVTLHHYVDDVNAAFEAAIANGAVVVSSVADTWWGEQTAVVVDPFGIRWSLAQRVEQLNAADRKARLEDMYAQPEEEAPVALEEVAETPVAEELTAQA